MGVCLSEAEAVHHSEVVHHIDVRTRLFVSLAALFVTSLIVGDIIGGKLLETHVFGVSFVISVGMIPFPITFLLTDILNEFYGSKSAQFVTWVGFCLALFAYTLLFVSMQLPWAELTRAASWTGMNESSFNNVFGGSMRILVASMVAYLFSQFADISAFNLLKRLSRNRFLWLRATGSTVASQLVDTVVIQTLAWYGLLSGGQIFRLVLTSYAVKLVIALGLTPLIYAGHAFVERSLGIKPVVFTEAGEPGMIEP